MEVQLARLNATVHELERFRRAYSSDDIRND